MLLVHEEGGGELAVAGSVDTRGARGGRARGYFFFAAYVRWRDPLQCRGGKARERHRRRREDAPPGAAVFRLAIRWSGLLALCALVLLLLLPLLLVVVVRLAEARLVEVGLVRLPLRALLLLIPELLLLPLPHLQSRCDTSCLLLLRRSRERLRFASRGRRSDRRAASVLHPDARNFAQRERCRLRGRSERLPLQLLRERRRSRPGAHRGRLARRGLRAVNR